MDRHRPGQDAPPPPPPPPPRLAPLPTHCQEMRFVFDESKDKVIIIEGNMNSYEHFNFTAKKAGSTVLFFAEVTRDKGQLCNVLCCKPLDSDDNGHCFGCKNQGYVDLRHPAGESLYVGGHVDCEFPFMWDSISEDDSD
ncbi:hypothetical protein CFC21_011782 [Triticum aestivum]|uniref:DUF3615 domain-containing protein n=4 Tax=Triticinae TaxID=1648030 RepID=A0A3B5ZVS6_WHEAT|nr:hypothetical protein CFC21_011782 [Triticum aestivum]